MFLTHRLFVEVRLIEAVEVRGVQAERVEMMLSQRMTVPTINCNGSIHYEV